MPSFLGAFMLRCWQGRDDAWRVEVIRVQDGARVVVATLEEAMCWIRAGAAGTKREQPPADQC
jgi:hypothetical protein